MLPAVGQGAVGIETRCDDDAILQRLAPLDDKATRLCISAERAMNKQLQGGCQIPIACYSQLEGNTLRLQGLVGSVDGKTLIKEHIQGEASQAEQLGTTLANQLLDKGAKAILAELIG